MASWTSSHPSSVKLSGFCRCGEGEKEEEMEKEWRANKERIQGGLAPQERAGHSLGFCRDLSAGKVPTKTYVSLLALAKDSLQTRYLRCIQSSMVNVQLLLSEMSVLV